MKNLFLHCVAITALAQLPLMAQTVEDTKSEPRTEAKQPLFTTVFRMDPGIPITDWKNFQNPFRTRAKVISTAPTQKTPELLPDSFEVISVAKLPTDQGTTEMCMVATPGDTHGIRELKAAPRILEDQDPTDDETDQCSFTMGGTRVWFIGLRGRTPAFWVEGTPKAETSLKFPKLKEARAVAERVTKTTRHINADAGSTSLPTAKTKASTGFKPGQTGNLEQFLNNLSSQ